MNANAGGGIGLWLDSSLEYETLDNISVFEPHVYESIFVKIKGHDNKDVIIGNCYRPNTAPLADINRATDIHSSILNKIRTEYRNCKVVLLGDFNIDLLQSTRHNLSNQYLESLLSGGFLPIITYPTRVHKQSATLIDHIFTNAQSNTFETGIITCLLYTSPSPRDS